MLEALREKVVETIRRVLGPEADLPKGRLELPSIKLLELIVALENEFGIHISEDAPLAHITSSVDRIIQYLRKEHAL